MLQKILLLAPVLSLSISFTSFSTETVHLVLKNILLASAI